jgi:hypothetical protein
MILKNWFKRRVKKIKLRIGKWNRDSKFLKPDRKEEQSDYERMSKAICRKLLNHPDSKFTIAPLSDKKYIINKEFGMFVIFQDNTVEIVNHVYHYITVLTERDFNKLIRMFDNKTESIRIQYENEIKSQISNSLNSIFEKISNSKNNI